MATVAIAFGGCLVLLTLSVFQFVAYFTDSQTGQLLQWYQGRL